MRIGNETRVSQSKWRMRLNHTRLTNPFLHLRKLVIIEFDYVAEKDLQLKLRKRLFQGQISSIFLNSICLLRKNRDKNQKSLLYHPKNKELKQLFS